MNESAYNPQLSYFDNIYFVGNAAAEAQPATTTVVRQMGDHAQKLRPAKRLNYRGGRHKLTEDERQARRERDELVRLQNQKEREDARIARQREDQRKDVMKLRARDERRIALKVREQLMSAAPKPKDPNAPVLLADCRLITTGILAMPGRTGIVIDARTTIFVRNGQCLQAAIDKHIAHRKAQAIL